MKDKKIINKCLRCGGEVGARGKRGPQKIFCSDGCERKYIYESEIAEIKKANNMIEEVKKEPTRLDLFVQKDTNVVNVENNITIADLVSNIQKISDKNIIKLCSIHGFPYSYVLMVKNKKLGITDKYLDRFKRIFS